MSPRISSKLYSPEFSTAADFTRFYFATLVSKEGGIPGPAVFSSSGPTHAQVYWNLINNVKQQEWDHRYGFVYLRV